MRPDELARLLKQDKQGKSFKLAAIPADYASGRPKLIFDGESTATVRTWPYASSYIPAANDRVLVAMVGKSGVILCKVV